MFKAKALADCQGLSFDIVFDMVLEQNILILAVDDRLTRHASKHQLQAGRRAELQHCSGEYVLCGPFTGATRDRPPCWCTEGGLFLFSIFVFDFLFRLIF